MTTIEFPFPLPRVHTGVHLANGRLGVLVWGEEHLNVTVAMAGFWDRRGTRSAASPMNYATLKSWLQSGREEDVRATFRTTAGEPYQIGGARFELVRPGARPAHAQLDLTTGCVTVTWTDGEVTRIEVAVDADRCHGTHPADTSVTLRPTWEWVGKTLAERGIAPPEHWASETELGMTQTLPEDAPLTLRWERRSPTEFCLTAALGLLQDLPEWAPASADRAVNLAYWDRYWRRLPILAVPPGQLQELVTYSLWKLGCLTNPRGVAATLQGPWMEEHRLPLWSNDYHFNINLEMIYWPCLHLGLGDHLRPLWTMVHGWMPQLRANGEHFFGAPGSMMLPHAVDDQCHPVGSYWQGTIDHASTAWTALLAWLDFDANGDAWVLHEIAWPLLNGAFEGFYAMLEPDGDGLCLPISVSPEYGEGAIGTWGANASFQLAAIHRLTQVLPQAASRMGVELDPRWAEVAQRLPRASRTLVPRDPWTPASEPDRWRIALWEGQDLEFSHRHHSHLAGVYPFASLGVEDAALVEESLHYWGQQGGGRWCAWSAAWAVVILARAGWRQGAEAWLAMLVASCINEGKSLSAGGARGVFGNGWGSADVARVHAHEGDHEVAQLDANMGLITAVIELYGFRVPSAP